MGEVCTWAGEKGDHNLRDLVSGSTMEELNGTEEVVVSGGWFSFGNFLLLMLITASPILLLIFIVLTRMMIAVLRYNWKKGSFKKLPRLPGLVPLFLIFQNNGILKLMKELMGKEGKLEPIVFMGPHLDGNPIVLCSNPEDLKNILVEKEFPKLPIAFSALKPLLGEGLVTSEGEIWRRQRKLITPIFHFAQLKQMIDIITKDACVWVEDMKKRSGEKLHCFNQISYLTLKVIINCAFGGELDVEEMIEHWHVGVAAYEYYLLSCLLFTRPVADLLPLPQRKTVFKSFKELTTALQANISDRRSRSDNAKEGGAKDLLEALLSAKDENGNSMPNKLLQDESLTFLGAGVDTTSNLLSWCMYYLSLNKRVQLKLQEEVDQVLQGQPPQTHHLPELVYCKQTLKEALRLRPPTPFLTRYAAKDCVLSGHHIPKGTYIYAFLLGAHMNKDYWKDPEVFRPERFSQEEMNEERQKTHTYMYIPFSAGSRNCIGQKFAMLEGTIILSLLMQNFTVEACEEEPVHTRLQGALSPVNFHCRLRPRT